MTTADFIGLLPVMITTSFLLAFVWVAFFSSETPV